MRSNRPADLRLCFRICKKRFSHNEAQIMMLDIHEMEVVVLLVIY